MKFKIFVPLFTAFLLVACSTSSSLPVPQVLPAFQAEDTRWFKLEQTVADGTVIQTSLLAVQPEKDMLRFVQTDALGAPVSRQTVSKRGWSNDGFVAPNSRSRRLFAAMLPLLDGNDKIYPQQQTKKQDGATVYFDRNQELWRSEVSDGLIKITFPDRTGWRITPLE
ncbi:MULTISPECIES: hypothetical protein [unclassified Neisseria]|uniref:hypothetical protein n=1 Tax=unclassified Neisseria TaxID=2623750 RepID=UPI002666B25A|nr:MULTISPECIES: hypothetical protein [unclassified Neisseria]MDO1509365.1 hypothetical protein [Neisseria sp. MVDL19-042950]MDO1515356.1 hypothetical protein [Neisseria sp. MVDL18-041461]MDO1562716.1 hypothetical protein [Neisseria sp. MVDL20-010259]